MSQCRLSVLQTSDDQYDRSGDRAGTRVRAGARGVARGGGGGAALRVLRAGRPPQLHDPPPLRQTQKLPHPQQQVGARTRN